MTPRPFPEFADEVMKLYLTGVHADKTAYKIGQVLTELALLIDAQTGELVFQTTADLRTSNLAKWVAWKGPEANPNTVAGLLCYARSIASYAVEEGYLDRLPAFRRLRPRERATTLNTALSYEGAVALTAYLRSHAHTWQGLRLYVSVTLVALTGTRAGEAFYARKDRLDLSNGELSIDESDHRLKTASSTRTVPLPDGLCKLLEEWLPHVEGQPWLIPGVRRRGPWTGGMPGSKPLCQLQAAAAAAGVGHVTWHGLRHTFGTHAVNRFAVPLWAVQEILGHTDIRTTRRYARVQAAALRPMVRSLDFAGVG